MVQTIDYDRSNSVDLILRAQMGDKAAMKELTVINTPLVKTMVKRFNNYATDREDLLQIGYIGLIKAIKGFDARFNVKFSTYAVPLIIGEIKRYIRDEGYVKVARSIKELRQKIRNFCDQYSNKYGATASIKDICDALGCDSNQVHEAIESGYAAVSLDQSINNDDNSADCLLNHVQSKKEIDWIDIIQLKESLNELSEEEKKIIAMRYYSNLTQTVIAQQLGMSQVQVSRLESRILKKLRGKMK